MQANEIIAICLAAVFLVSIFTALGMSFYLGRNKIKEIDRLVYGHETSRDIFSLILRLPAYGGAFAWRWSAKRSHLLYIRDKFDKKFQRPFIITYYLYMLGGLFMILLFIGDKYFLKIT